MKVVTDDGVLAPWLQQAQDRGLISDGKINLDAETHQMFLEWQAAQEPQKNTLH